MKNVALILVLFITGLGWTQTSTDQQLAQHYYNNGEFDKATSYYEKLFKKEPSKYYFTRLFECYNQTEAFKAAEKLVKRHWNSNKYDLDYPVLLGDLYERTDEVEKANKIYDQLIDDLVPRANEIIKLYDAFRAMGKNEFAFKTIQKGRKMLKGSYPLHFQFADYYGATGQMQKMLSEYLDLLDYHPGYKLSIQRRLSSLIDFDNQESEEYTLLKTELLKRAQNHPQNKTYSDMLVWMFVQSKNFNAALAQTKALDKRSEGGGLGVFNLGKICVKNRAYSVARQAFDYVVSLGTDNPLYYQAESALLNTRFLEITTNRNYSKEEIQHTITAYQSVLNRLGKRVSTVPLILELTHIQAFYGQEIEAATGLLRDGLEMQALTDMQRAQLKMQLADIEVLHGDIWEASLLYMQIDKAFKYEAIGHEARFKNARVFYYDGEFDYAQAQLDVLKQATSKLISNDAIELSLLITDNFGLDSNYAAMFWYASADLLIEQHRYPEAFQLFDSIIENFPYHSLGDEILLKKSVAMQQQGKWSEAIGFLDELLKYHGEDILADNALYKKGVILEEHLYQTEAAMECYKTILIDFKGSLYATEARKRFRRLRGEDTGAEDINREEF